MTPEASARGRESLLSGSTAARLSRRSVLSAGLAATFAISACSTGPGNDPEKPPASVDLGGEAPMLAEKVESGDLPPVDERLPSEPLVVEPVDRAGQYGGAWRTAINGPGDSTWLDLTVGYEGLVRWSPEWTGAAGDAEVIPNIAQSYETNADGTEFTFVLRPGMRWSDGEPFTTADIQFNYEALALNEEIGPIDSRFQDGDGVAGLEIVDETTFKFTFSNPQGLFIPRLAENWALTSPKHYLEQFHADFNDDIDQVVSDEGYDHWVDLLGSKNDRWSNPERPTLNAWVIKRGIGDGNVVTAERNPYYWKVDPGGNQLPYLDEVRFDVMSEEEVILAAVLQGDLNMHMRHVNTDNNKPVLAEGREQGGYQFFDQTASLANQLVVMLNLTHEDEVKREIFNNKDFRIGLSHAISREEIINTVFQRQGEPSQAAPQPTSPFYSEEMATQFIEFDVDLANQHLDKAGYADKDSNGIRLGPDGEPIRFRIEHAGLPGQDDALALISQYWAAVGVAATPDGMDRSLYEERRRANSPDAMVWAAGGGVDVVQNPYWYVPLTWRADYGHLWADWYTSKGKSGQEPPEATRRQFELYDELRTTVDAERQTELMTEIVTIAAQEFYHIGIVQPQNGGYGIVADDFHNVPDVVPGSYLVKPPGVTNPEQFFVQG